MDGSRVPEVAFEGEIFVLIWFVQEQCDVDFIPYYAFVA